MTLAKTQATISPTEFEALRKCFLHESSAIVRGDGYLDKLNVVYPSKPQSKSFNFALLARFRELHRDAASSNVELLRTAFALGLSINHPMANMLKRLYNQRTSYWTTNTQSISEIASKLRLTPLDMLLAPAREVKASRQNGPLFRNYCAKQLKQLSERQFRLHYEGIASLHGESDNTFKAYATRFMDYTNSKGMDGIFKVNDIHVAVEAKLITDSGGSQTHQLKDALSLAASFDNTRHLGIAVIDGEPWWNTSYAKQMRESGVLVCSALVLADCLKHIQESLA